MRQIRLDRQIKDCACATCRFHFPWQAAVILALGIVVLVIGVVVAFKI